MIPQKIFKGKVGIFLLFLNIWIKGKRLLFWCSREAAKVVKIDLYILTQNKILPFWNHPLPRIPNSSSSVTFFLCAMDLGNRVSYHRSAGVKTTERILKMKFKKKSLTHYPIIALLRGSHGLSPRRAWRTLSSRPEGPKAGPRGRNLEVGARRAPRLLLLHIPTWWEAIIIITILIVTGTK